jgi:phage shock protein E
MIQLLKNIFGLHAKLDYRQLLQNGAQIIDVRTQEEFQNGHIKGSLNIPLQNLQNNFSKINKDKPVITCCASGMRSASAKGMLQSKGFSEVHNGGGWMSLQKQIN